MNILQRNRCHLTLRIVLSFSLICVAGVSRVCADDRPNIVLIMADDLGFSDIGCYGGEIETPNLDALAAKSTRFRQFYNAGRCCPTRASLMTGLYPHAAGVGHMMGESNDGQYFGDLTRKTQTIAETLKSAGYMTYMSGKWHLTPWPGKDPEDKSNWPRQRGFDRFYGTITSIRSYYNPPSLTRDNDPLPATEGDYHFTDAISDAAVDFVREHDAAKPMFLYVAYTAPHWPMHARSADIEHYAGRYKSGWDQLRQSRLDRMRELGVMTDGAYLTPRDRQSIAWDDVDPKYHEWLDHRMAVYAAMVTQMDRGIGRVLDELIQRSIDDNTIVLFLSDNGGCAEEIGPAGRSNAMPTFTRDRRVIRLGNDPAWNLGEEDTYGTYGLQWANASNTPFRRYKQFMHEGGIATPMIAHWPGHFVSGWNDQVGHVIDIAPTLYSAAKISVADQSLAGTSLLPQLEGRETSVTRTLGWEHEGNSAFREGNFKIVREHGQPWQLFDLSSDRTESFDQTDASSHVCQRLIDEYERWAARNGVKPWRGESTPIGWPDLDRYRKKK